MIKISKDNSEQDLQDFAYRWFKLFSENRINEAILLLDETNSYGTVWTEDTIKKLIEVDTFGSETRFGREHPEGVTYSNPETIKKPDYCIASLIEFTDGRGYSYEHDFPLNGTWSDLTAHFEFKKIDDHFAVILNDLHVM